MRSVLLILVIIIPISLLPCSAFAGDTRDSGDELTKVKSEYADVLALQGTAKGEILAIAKILRAKPRIAVDQTAASGEYCFNSGLGTMVHFATRPEGTAEDVVYEFDASGLIAAGLDPSRLTATRTRPNETRRLVFPSERGARSSSRPRDDCAHDSNRNQH
jgi:hypothetical protein